MGWKDGWREKVVAWVEAETGLIISGRCWWRNVVEKQETYLSAGERQSTIRQSGGGDFGMRIESHERPTRAGNRGCEKNKWLT
jgi:hypothetical protein